ncbi:unnamed protein product [Timema podura]|uniref:39S ribosomal protein L30, mitochondrial n=1 Tax=Timema podura TaxID=61482 RepID=A0ABN7P515_TIMPD|nr:unnamed protein product [Timema podura]
MVEIVVVQMMLDHMSETHSSVPFANNPTCGHPSVVVKNIPEVNARLWKIKHLVEITPITFPQGPPQEGDYGGTFLKENGEFVVSPRLQVDSARIEETAKFIGDESKMDGPTLKKQLRLRWLNPFNLD